MSNNGGDMGPTLTNGYLACVTGNLCASIPPKCLIDEMPALRECRADGGGRIARRHFGMAEEFGALSLSPPAHFVEDIHGLGMVGRIGQPDQTFIRADRTARTAASRAA